MAWLLLINTVSGQNGSLRLRLWRQLKAVGAAALRDGVYLLPVDQALQTALKQLRDELVAAEGTAYVVQLPEQNAEIEAEWRTLFDRSAEYREWSDALRRLIDAPPAGESEARRQLRQRGKELDAIKAIDFFPSEAREQSERTWEIAERQLIRHFSPDEPTPEPTKNIRRLKIVDFQGKRWATRARPWVDRVASAWLIKRFIDRDAEFIWLSDIKTCPADAFGFDFDGATFSHVGELVTFQVLLASFALDRDVALTRLGAMVHALDVDGESPPEAAGFEALLTGARSRLTNDDELLAEISGVLDSLYAYFQLERKS